MYLVSIYHRAAHVIAFTRWLSLYQKKFWQLFLLYTAEHERKVCGRFCDDTMPADLYCKHTVEQGRRTAVFFLRSTTATTTAAKCGYQEKKYKSENESSEEVRTSGKWFHSGGLPGHTATALSAYCARVIRLGAKVLIKLPACLAVSDTTDGQWLAAKLSNSTSQLTNFIDPISKSSFTWEDLKVLTSFWEPQSAVNLRRDEHQLKKKKKRRRGWWWKRARLCMHEDDEIQVFQCWTLSGLLSHRWAVAATASLFFVSEFEAPGD